MLSSHSNHSNSQNTYQNWKLESVGLWRLYINITITILDIIHRPVFYLKFNSTLYVCSYLTGNTLRLRYEPNRLMLSIGLWRWYVNITITTLDIIHHPVFYLKTRCFGDWILSLSSGGTYSNGPNRKKPATPPIGFIKLLSSTSMTQVVSFLRWKDNEFCAVCRQ
jgi:hypothetical protein